jgi:hypothetical protein
LGKHNIAQAMTCFKAGIQPFRTLVKKGALQPSRHLVRADVANEQASNHDIRPSEVWSATVQAARHPGQNPVPRSEASRQAADDEAPLSATGSRPNLQNAVYTGVAAHQTAPKLVVPLARIFPPGKTL